jgi:hypothetical protein
MKSILLFSLIVSCSLFYTVSFSQTCTQEIAAFMAAPGGYNISGAGLIEDDQQSTILYFDNAFNTQSGPDLHVYLSINFESPTTPGNTNIDIGELTSNSGAQSYTVPSNVSLGDYNYVLIHCKSFNHWWGGGLFGEINCVSSTNPLDGKLSPTVYPNPTNDFLNISFAGQNLEKIIVTNLLGQNLINQVVSGQKEIQIEMCRLEPGLYTATGLNASGVTVFYSRVIKM